MIWLYKISIAIEICKIKVAHNIIFVVDLGCKPSLNLLVKYKAPMLMIGRPNAAQMPAISKRVIGLGSKK